jgi:cytochrome subunit of sulfide dehydrogenase
MCTPEPSQLPACPVTDPTARAKQPSPASPAVDKDYFVKAMQNYKSGKRMGTIMKKHAAGYTDAEFEAMGAYFASLK